MQSIGAESISRDFKAESWSTRQYIPPETLISATDFLLPQNEEQKDLELKDYRMQAVLFIGLNQCFIREVCLLRKLYRKKVRVVGSDLSKDW